MKFDVKTKYHFNELWCFVAFVFGVIFYFGLPIEVPVWIWICASLILGFCSFVYRRQELNIGLFFVIGLLVVSLRTTFIQTEFLYYPKWNQELSGDVVSAFATYKGQVVFLKNLRGKMPFIPKQVRLSFREKEPLLIAGDHIKFKGHLFPPQAHQRIRSFYQGIEAQGSLSQLIDRQRGQEPFNSKIRGHIMKRLQAVLTSQQYQIACP